MTLGGGENGEAAHCGGGGNCDVLKSWSTGARPFWPTQGAMTRDFHPCRLDFASLIRSPLASGSWRALDQELREIRPAKQTARRGGAGNAWIANRLG
jgi:hypothetical protein